MRRAGAAALALLAFAGLGVGVARARPVTAAAAPAPHPALPDEADRWADSVLATLSLRGKVAQMFMRWTPGTMQGDADPDLRRAMGWVGDDSIGGVVISIGHARELAEKLNLLQRRARIPLLVAADLEFGAGQRAIPEATMFPQPMGIAATGDPDAACTLGRITAREARALGIHWTFAPNDDLDVARNPFSNVRAFGATREAVTRYAEPFVRCAQSEGLLTTAKHLVAAGSSDADSHLGLQVVTATRRQLDTLDLAPFRALQRVGVAAMMSSHVSLPRITGDSTPLSLSPRLLGGIVRGDWRYDGLIVTDAFWMGAVRRSRGYTPEGAAVRAVRAGNDVIADPADHATMIRAIVDTVRAGGLTEARIDSSVRRILRAKARVGLHRTRTIDVAALASRLATPEHDSAARVIAARSIVVARNARVAGSPALPLAMRRADGAPARIAVVLYFDEGRRPSPGIDEGTPLLAELRAQAARSGASVEELVLPARANARTLTALVNRAVLADRVVLAAYVRPIASKGSIGLPAAVRAAAETLLRRRPDATLVSFGDPHLARDLPRPGAYVLAWNPRSRWSETAAARVLVAAAPATGTLPVTIAPDMWAGTRAPVDAGPSAVRASAGGAVEVAGTLPPARAQAGIADTLRRILDRAVADSAFPGAVAVVGNARGIVASYGAGHLDWSASPRPDERTIWDMASLTKVIGMTTAMMQLVEQGKVDLDAPVQRYLPRFTGAGKERVRVRDLLTHSSGLPSWRSIYKEATSPESALALVYATPLDTAPGVRYVYSDLGAILLGQIVEQLSGERLDAYLDRHLFAPLAMRDTRYRPPASLRDRIAPTEVDPWRQRHLRGEVHDENAFALGGVSGHAGLFSTGADLARFCRMLLGGGTLDSTRVVGTETLRRFTTRQTPALSHRAFGWETATGENSGGHRMSGRAFGHTGFTGTSIWVDPERDVFIILLTNRVNPTRENRKIGAVRVRLADAVMAALGVPAPSPSTGRS